MANSIFFDLETSDRNPIGQILNYCFLEVDENYAVVGECKGLVRISRTEIPDPEAILANRVAVIEHQREASRSEYEAALHIRDFIVSVVAKQKEQVPLIGYNSSRFDIPFLRTTLIRNGVNPYFQSKIVGRDLYHVVQKAFLSHAMFAEPLVIRGREKAKMSLSLEAVSQTLGLLDGSQAHESEFDVLLTIRVAKTLHELYGLDVRSFEACEVASFYGQSPIVVRTLQPNYELDSPSIYRETEMMLLTNDNRGSLWVDLGQYREGAGRESIRWLSIGRHSVVVDQALIPSAELEVLTKKARDEFRDVTLRNFFPKSTCDIEQDIYRVDFDGIRILGGAIQAGNDSELKASNSRDLKILFTRFKLRNATTLAKVERGLEFFRMYALNRYGGTALLSKTLCSGREPELHQSLRQRVSRMRELRESLKGSTDTVEIESTRLLKELEEYTLSSELVALAGDALLS